MGLSYLDELFGWDERREFWREDEWPYRPENTDKIAIVLGFEHTDDFVQWTEGHYAKFCLDYYYDYVITVEHDDSAKNQKSPQADSADFAVLLDSVLNPTQSTDLFSTAQCKALTIYRLVSNNMFPDGLFYDNPALLRVNGEPLTHMDKCMVMWKILGWYEGKVAHSQASGS